MLPRSVTLAAALLAGCHMVARHEARPPTDGAGSDSSIDSSPIDSSDLGDSAAGDGAPDGAPGGCTPPEVLFGGHCYRYVRDGAGFTWSEGQAVCAGLGAELVKIETLAENDFLYGLIEPGVDRAWTGLRAAAPGANDWLWTDGTTPSYYNWAPGEPNNYLGENEDCGDMNGSGHQDPLNHSRWNDELCDAKISSVLCERVP